MSFLDNLEDKIYQNELEKTTKRIKEVQKTYLDFSQEDCRKKAEELRQRAKKGEKLEKLLVESYALVSMVACRVLGYSSFYDSQIKAAIALNDNCATELATGEGKTSTATLPAFLNALTGAPVHIITSNEYLAKRDSEWMGQVFNYLGLSVGCIYSGQDKENKKAAYQCDITYGTSSEFGFDFLRDNMCKNKNEKVGRGMGFALIDEVDSILIDEAKTPLVISKKDLSDIEKYKEAAQVIDQYITEDDVEIDYSRGTVYFADSGYTKIEMVYGMKENGLFNGDHTNLLGYLNNALTAKFIMKKGVDYVLEDGKVCLIDKRTGRPMKTHRFSNGLHSAIEAKEHLEDPLIKINGEDKTLAMTTYQRYYARYKKLAGMSGTILPSKDEFENLYKLKVVKIDPHTPPKRIDEVDRYAYTKEEKMKLIVEEIVRCREKQPPQPVLVGTATIEDSMILSELLDEAGIPHETLNAKNEARESSIIAHAGETGAVTIATNMAGRGTDIKLGGDSKALARRDFVNKYKLNSQDLAKAEIIKKFNIDAKIIDTLIESFENDTNESIPEIIKLKEYYYELITSFEEMIDKKIADYKEGIDDPTLEGAKDFYNSRLNYYKSNEKARKDEVLSSGGLRVIGAERQESRRVDDQLMGRSGRQGDEGSSVFYVSLFDDNLMNFATDKEREYINEIFYSGKGDDPKVREKISKIIKEIQVRKESEGYATRKNTLQFSGIYNVQMDDYHKQRDKILDNDNIIETIYDSTCNLIDEIFDQFKNREIDKNECNRLINMYILPEERKFLNDETIGKYNLDQLKTKLYSTVKKKLQNTELLCAGSSIRENLTDKMKSIALQVLDGKWSNHIDSLNSLKSDVGFKSLTSNQNPIYTYNIDADKIYKEMLSNSRREMIQLAMQYCTKQSKIYEMFYIRNPRPLKGPIQPGA